METLNQLTSVDIHAQASTSAVSVPQRIYPDGMRPEFDFGALGIYNAPCWSVELPDGSGGTQVLPVPRAPLVEGLPLPPNIQEPHKAAYEYLFELVGALKHMMVTRETENMALVSALRSRARKRKGKG
ncbi:serine/threonine-protein phosphatase 7 inactive homolog [Cajanus cajan]|uniref:serine/threonine-protein phosphatase 7 inactive homolog n=1 Tax=Cajanus cajan TaxID=3821 RepID=UPI00098DB03A|nr:serine/threonine-protein phosphatase 7 inactive homolog [Cajanus cajan]